MKIIFLCLILTHNCLAQPRIEKLNTKSLPKTIHYKNNLIHAVRWKDNSGDNIVVLSSTLKTAYKKTDPTDDSFLDAELHAEHYIVLADSIKKSWHIDEIGPCPFDFYLYFIDKAFAVTDLNHDGNAEVWIMYQAGCGSNIVPTNIIMYEKGKKYILVGKRKVSSTEYDKGTYTLDDNFKSSSPEFREYAEKLWMQVKIEK